MKLGVPIVRWVIDWAPGADGELVVSQKDVSGRLLPKAESAPVLLEEMRAASEAGAPPAKAAASAAPPNVPAPSSEPPVLLGLAGFLILVGVASFILGGPLWEGKGFNDDGSQPEGTTTSLAHCSDRTSRAMTGRLRVVEGLWASRDAWTV